MSELSSILLQEDYMSNTTQFVHLFVMDVAKLSMYVLELLSVIIIVYSTFVAFYKLFKHQSYARVYLLHGQSIGLTFKLGSEILRTVVARNIDDIWEVALLIAIKAAMVLLIDWELKSIEKEGDGDGHLGDFDHEKYENRTHRFLKSKGQQLKNEFYAKSSDRKADSGIASPETGSENRPE